jgi:hypothetical protein
MLYWRCLILLHCGEKMRILTSHSTQTDTKTAIADCFQGLDLNEVDELSWLLFFHTEDYDSQLAVTTLSQLSGSEKIHGGTSCLGLMTSAGFHSDNGCGMGVLAISDPEGSYGVGAADIGGQPRMAATQALHAALEQAERIGEVPALVWLNAAPGREEELLAGIEDVVGSKVPIAGGSSGDNKVTGKWRQFAGKQVYDDAIVVSVFFPSVDISYAFHSGYNPTEVSGKVTSAKGRILSSIDNRPAAEVYNEWTDGLIETELATAGTVLSSTTFSPLGREVGRVGGVPYYKLSHPERVTRNGSITLFSDIAEGDEVFLMTGSRASLISRAGRVTQAAISDGEFSTDSISGALVIYCAGCMLAVQDDMDKVAAEISSALSGAPFLGVFTFGEQGCFVGHENSHGNLMISVVVFSEQSAF